MTATIYVPANAIISDSDIVAGSGSTKDYTEILLGLGALGAGGIKLGTPDGAATTPADVQNIEAIGRLLYSKYLFLFDGTNLRFYTDDAGTYKTL